MKKRRETLAQNAKRFADKRKANKQIIHQANKRIIPITLDNCDWDSQLGCRMIDGFIAVLDARKDLPEAMEFARVLTEKEKIQAIALARNSKTQPQSFKAIAKFMDKKNRFGPGASEGCILPWPKKNKYIYVDRQITALITNKTLRFRNANNHIGEDFHRIFTSARQIFPEYLSWNIRNKKSGLPGGLHYDERYRPGLHNLLNLPKRFYNSVNGEKFTPLLGNITMLVTSGNGGTIICNSHEILPTQNFYDLHSTLTGYQGQNGDLLILRGQGWGAGFHPAFHCAPVVDNLSLRRYVAVASSNASYLAPQVRELLGRSRLPSQDLLNRFLDDFDTVRNDVAAGTLVKVFSNMSPEILRNFPKKTLDRFPKETARAIYPILETV